MAKMKCPCKYTKEIRRHAPPREPVGGYSIAVRFYSVFFFKSKCPASYQRFSNRNITKNNPMSFHFAQELHKNLIFLAIITRNWKKICNFAITL